MIKAGEIYKYVHEDGYSDYGLTIKIRAFRDISKVQCEVIRLPPFAAVTPLRLGDVLQFNFASSIERERWQHMPKYDIYDKLEEILTR